MLLAALLLVGFLYSWLITKHQSARSYSIMAGFFFTVFMGILVFIG
jgi:hypothetical protein